MGILTPKGWALCALSALAVALPFAAVFGPWALIPGGLLGAAAFVLLAYYRW